MRPQQIGQKRSKIMGRPLGSRDRFPRGTAKAEKLKLLESENGALRRENADLKQEIEQPHPRFPGDAVELLESAQHGDYHPTWLQFRAALALYERDFDRRRADMDAARASLEQERIEYREGDATLERLIADFRKVTEFTADRDDALSELLEAGEVTPAGAKAIRSWFIEKEFWSGKPERLALPAPSPQARPHAQDDAPATEPHPDAIIAPSAPASAPGTPWSEPVPQIARVLFADRPFVYFQTASGRRLESNSACEVELDGADADDIRDLLRAGCRERSSISGVK